ncbi:hypothetical protein BH23CHL10_BH23CHL10_10670 [soil metagenome]
MIGAPAADRSPAGIPLGIAVLGLAALLVLLVAAALDAVALGVGLVAVTGVAIALITRPDSAALIAIALVFTNATVIAMRFHGMPGYVAAVVPMLLAVALGYRVFVRREAIVVLPQVPWLVLLLFAHLISTVFARDIGPAAAGMVDFLVEGVILFLLFTNAIRTRTILVHALWVLVAAGGFLGGLSALQQVTGTFDDNYFGFAQVSNAILSQGEGGAAVEGPQPRLAGPLGEKNHYAQYMLMLFPVGLMLAWSERRRTWRFLAIALTILVMLGVVLTFSRGAAVGMAAVLMVMALLGYVHFRQLALVGALVVGLLIIFPQYTQRLAALDVQEASSNRVIMSRATENVAAALVFVDHPLVGVGPNLFPSYYRDYAVEFGALVRSSDRESHNLFLGIAAELGIIGLVAFLGILTSISRRLLRARAKWRATQPEAANIASGLLLSLVAFVSSGLFLHLSYARYFWLIAAIAAAGAWVLLREAIDDSAEPSIAIDQEADYLQRP